MHYIYIVHILSGDVLSDPIENLQSHFGCIYCDMNQTIEISLRSNDNGAYCIKNPGADKAVMIVLGNYEVAYVRGRTSTEIGKSKSKASNIQSFL